MNIIKWENIWKIVKNYHFKYVWISFDNTLNRKLVRLYLMLKTLFGLCFSLFHYDTEISTLTQTRKHIDTLSLTQIRNIQTLTYTHMHTCTLSLTYNNKCSTLTMFWVSPQTLNVFRVWLEIFVMMRTKEKKMSK